MYIIYVYGKRKEEILTDGIIIELRQGNKERGKTDKEIIVIIIIKRG